VSWDDCDLLFRTWWNKPRTNNRAKNSQVIFHHNDTILQTTPVCGVVEHKNMYIRKRDFKLLSSLNSQLELVVVRK
jgi:hypothetical protein